MNAIEEIQLRATREKLMDEQAEFERMEDFESDGLVLASTIVAVLGVLCILACMGAFLWFVSHPQQGAMYVS